MRCGPGRSIGSHTCSRIWGEAVDYKIDKNAELFDELLDVLNKDRGESGVLAAIEKLEAAKFNYGQRSLDHMLKALVLTVYDLVLQQTSKELQKDLGDVIRDYVNWSLQAGARISALAHEYEPRGGKPLSRDEILQEVDERRGTSR